MAEIREGNSTPAKTNKFWENNEFREKIRRIKERENVAAPTATTTTPAPIPVKESKSQLSFRASPRRSVDTVRRTSEQVVRDRVEKELFNSPMSIPGATPEKIKEFVDKKVKEELDKVRQPRYVMTADGRPFYLSKEAEREALEMSLAGESEGRKRWTMFKYDAAQTINRTLASVSEPSLQLKELLTDKDKPNAIGALAQLGLNTTILGVEYLRAGLNQNAQAETLASQYRQAAEAAKYTDPAKADELLKRAEQMDRLANNYKAIDERISIAKQAVKESWAQLQDAREANVQGEGAPGGYGPEAWKRREQYFAQLKAEEEAAKQEASGFRDQANAAYTSGDYDSAINLIKQAQDADRRGDPLDSYGAYTWIREPERYDKFLEDAALIELQKGAPLTQEEIRRLKDYHANGWTEITGELIYDPLNFLPASVIEDAIKVPVRATRAVGETVTELPGIAKAVNILGSPVRWLRRESIASGGNRIARTTHNLFSRISTAYSSTDDMVRAVDDVGAVVLDAKRAANEEAATAIFNSARERVPGLQNITFREFKGLMDAADNVDPTQWGKMLSDSLGNAEDILTNNAVRAGKDPTELISDLAKSRIAMEDMASGFYKAFTDPHRIYKGSSFYDDSIAGWVTKTLRELSGDEVNDIVKAHKFDEFVMKYGETINPRMRGAIRDVNKLVEATLHVTSFARDIWAGLVLATPRWLVNNLMDTAFRDVVYGGNLWDDLGTLFTSSQRTLADELGFVPIEFSQALSRADLEFANTVPARLLYENWKPKAGIFSYWNYEYNRILQTDPIVAKRQILDNMLSSVPEGKFKSAMTWLGDGLNVKLPTVLKSWQGGVSDFNTAIEFTFRLRMFHREYFKLLETLEPGFLARGLDGLSPATREIAKQIWKMSEGNPRRLSAYVDSVVGNAQKGTPAQWSLVVPNEIERVTKGMDAVDRQLFISTVRAQLDEFIQAALKNGEDITGSKVSNFFDDYKMKLQDEIQAHMAQTWDKRQAQNVLAKDGEAVPTPNLDDLKGSAPIPAKERPVDLTIDAATKRLRKSNRFRKIVDVANDYEAAVIDYAKLERVPGDGVRLVNRGGERVIELGDNVLKKKTSQLYSQLHDVTLQIFKTTDTDAVLRGGFNNLDEYETAVRKFMDDPNLVLKDNERQFMTIANQFTVHPQLKELLARTGKDFNFDSALDVYRNFSVYDDAYGFTRPPEEILQEMANQKIVVPGHHVAAAQEEALSTRKLGEVYLNKNIPEATRVKIGTFMEQWDAYRKQMRQFWTFVAPGPKMFKAGEGRRAAWDMFYNLGTEAYLKEAKIKDDLVKLFETDPAAAERLLDEAQENFADWFLKQNGMEVTWDADRQIILNTKLTRNGKTVNLASRLDNAAVESYFYRPQIQRQMKENPVLRVDLNGQTNTRTSLTQVLRDTFEMPNERAEAWARVIDSHAKKWSQETGQDINKYYERLGFQRFEGGLGIGQVKGDNAIRLVKRGAINRDAQGRFIFYGLGHSNFESMVRETAELFFDDLVSMAEHSKQAADDLDALRSFIENKTGKKIIGNALNQEQSQVFTEMFTRYVAEGVGPDIKLKKPFERAKGWLTSTFEAVHTTPLGAELSDDIYRTMDRMFIESKIMDVPKTNNRTIHLMADETGLTGYDDETLLKIINESIVDPERGKLVREQADLNKRMWEAKTREELAPIQERLREVDEILNPSVESQRLVTREDLVRNIEKQRQIYEEAVQEATNELGELAAADSSYLRVMKDGVDEAEKALDDFDKFMSVSTPSQTIKWSAEGFGSVLGQSDAPTVSMSSAEFLGLNPVREGMESLDWIRTQMLEGKEAGRPVLYLKWEGDHWKVTGHEGRGRSIVAQSMGQPVEVNLIYEGVDEITPAMRNAPIHPASDAPDPSRIVRPRSTELYRGSASEIGPMQWFTPDKEAAEEYASLYEGGVVTRAELPNNKKLAGENDILETLREMGIDPDSNSLYGHLSPEQSTSAEQLIKTLQDKGFDGVHLPLGEDFAPNGKAIESYLLFGNPLDVPVPKQAFTSLGDVPKDVAARALGTPESPVVSKAVSEIDEAWEVWRTSRQLKGFPEEALQSSDIFKAYLKDRINAEWSEPAQHYNRMLWEVEQFENAMLNYHAGTDYATHLFPRIPEAEISDGMKTWIRNNDDMLNNYESALQALDIWKKYMGDVIDNGHPALALPKEQMTELVEWSKRASADKAEMVDILLKGGMNNGRTYEGAIDRVNRVMLDYQHRSVFDNFMKNFFPFWMFPSRSFPFWVETMATHPQLIANYEKIQRLSRNQRYQMGAITSSGKPLPSLDGYIPIPGTDLWFNPLAPFSFRYALDVTKSLDNILYSANTAEEDVDPKAFMVKEFMQTSQIYGFSVAPWMTFLMKEAYNIPDEIIPRYPLLPQISLIPRWMVPDMIRLGNKTISTHKDQWYPEASWHDYMVERKLLEDALAQIRSGNLSESEKLKLMSQVSEAIKNKGDNATWQQAYQDLTNDETARNWGSFFTGFYAKPFTDGQAEMLKLRNEINLYKSAMNNEFQSDVFELPDDADAAWEGYLNKLDTPEGWTYRLYTDIGWVRNELGEQVSNPQERAKYLAMKIEQDENQQLYYQRMSDLQEEYNKRIRALPVGATYEQMKPVWDWYAVERGRLQSLRDFEKHYGTNKPTELIQRDLRNDWFRAVNETRPTWDVTNGETYDQYQQRVADWEKNLPNIAASLMKDFRKDNVEVNMTIGKLKPDQGFDTSSFFSSLVSDTNIEGINAWEIENDDVFDALNKAWKATYWDAYWNSGVLEGGYSSDLAEKDFYQKNPNPPSASELYVWIQQNYGDRFTFAEIKKWVDESDVSTIQERNLQDKPADYQTRQEIWDMLSMLGPGSKNREVFDDAFAANGGDPDALTAWYQEGGEAFTTKPEKLKALYDAINKTVRQLDLKSPSRPELIRYVQAQEENDKFQAAVKSELGESFYDLLGYYNNLDRQAQREFQGEQPDMYQVIDDYYNMKSEYEEGHPVWADYYGSGLEPTITPPGESANPPAAIYQPPNPRKKKNPRPERDRPQSFIPSGGAGRPQYRYMNESYSQGPQFNIQSRILSSFSPQFLQTVGNKLTWEISQLYSSNRRLSSAAVGFLSNLGARHPEWNKTIRDILARNG